MKPTVLCAVVLALLSTMPASAAQHWKVDYARSKLGFTVSWSNQPFTAVFRSWKADIDFDPADLAHSRASVTVNLASETSDDSETDDGIKGADGFQVSQFPTALFRVASFTHAFGDRYVATGTLSIKGLSRPITLPFTLTMSGATAHVVGKAVVLRTDFHVGTGEWAKADPVAYEVTVNVDLVASKSGT